MFWADGIVQEIKERYAGKIKKGEPIIIRDEKTASGRVHVRLSARSGHTRDHLGDTDRAGYRK